MRKLLASVINRFQFNKPLHLKILESSVDTTSIWVVTKKMTCKEAIKRARKSWPITHIVRDFKNEDRIAINSIYEVLISIFPKRHFNIVEKLGTPLIIVREYESSPGLWILKDKEFNITYLIWSDSWKKNPEKGTSVEIIINPENFKDLEKSSEKFLKFILEKL